MSGHNKWSKIKHKKAATDAKKSKEFSKIVRLIKVEAKKAGGNVDSPGLKMAMEKAKAVNMPKDNIERAIKSASGENEAELESVLYEAYGPGGAAMIISAITDNRNRTSAEIKHTLSKRDLELASPGSAMWAFNKEGGEWKAESLVELAEQDLEKLSELVDELESQDDTQDVYTNAS